jgi:hypothetical protein
MYEMLGGVQKRKHERSETLLSGGRQGASPVFKKVSRLGLFILLIDADTKMLEW